MAQKNILIFGAGKSATTLIHYVLTESEELDFTVTIADADKKLAELKANNHPNSRALQINVQDADARRQLIAGAALVISMMPPQLHSLIAVDCIELSKSLLTASYMDESISKMDEDAKNKGIVLLCEMGLDPGIDHMSAMKLFDEIKQTGATITSFKSHCGGLVAPESDDNPWHYKISWNPRNVVLAGKAGAIFKEDGIEKEVGYHQLFDAGNSIGVVNAEIGELSYYPNRNSLSYIDIYDVGEASNFIRTTLRYPAFMSGWKQLIEAGFTDEAELWGTDNLSLAAFFRQKLGDDKINTIKDCDSRFYQQLVALGLNDNTTIINKGKVSAADIMQFILEKKLILLPHDKDMVVMVHEIEYEKDSIKKNVVSKLIVNGENALHTAMSKTVGLPLGIAAKLLLQEKLKLSGALIPTGKDIYEPVLQELEKQGIIFEESWT